MYISAIGRVLDGRHPLQSGQPRGNPPCGRGGLAISTLSSILGRDWSYDLLWKMGVKHPMKRQGASAPCQRLSSVEGRVDQISPERCCPVPHEYINTDGEQYSTYQLSYATR